MIRSVRLVSLVAVLASALACGKDSSTPTAPTVNVPFTTTDLRVGTGVEATNGRRATVNYTGWLYSTTGTDNKGTQFDSSLTAGRSPFAFVVGGGQVIAGWDRGVVGMRVGGTRRLIIPPELGYGSAGSGSTIPPNSTLVFDIDLLSVQ